jgi:hypothetical protein
VPGYAQQLFRSACVVLLLQATTACSGVNLGQIDETVDSREEMPGPGIFADDKGQSVLKWSSDSEDPASTSKQSDSSATQQQAEFAQFKTWNNLRTNASDSPEYQEFLQWLEYQKFKANQ